MSVTSGPPPRGEERFEPLGRGHSAEAAAHDDHPAASWGRRRSLTFTRRRDDARERRKQVEGDAGHGPIDQMPDETRKRGRGLLDRPARTQTLGNRPQCQRPDDPEQQPEHDAKRGRGRVGVGPVADEKAERRAGHGRERQMNGRARPAGTGAEEPRLPHAQALVEHGGREHQSAEQSGDGARGGFATQGRHEPSHDCASPPRRCAVTRALRRRSYVAAPRTRNGVRCHDGGPARFDGFKSVAAMTGSPPETPLHRDERLCG